MTPVWVLPTIIGITFIINLATQLINLKFTDQKFMKETRAKMTSIQKSITATSTKAEIDKAQTEIMNLNNVLMKHTMKPTMYTFIPLIIVYWGLGALFTQYGDLITWGVNVPIFGPAVSWLGTYVIFSFIFSLTLKPLITKIGDKLRKNKKQEGDELNA